MYLMQKVFHGLLKCGYFGSGYVNGFWQSMAQCWGSDCGTEMLAARNESKGEQRQCGSYNSILTRMQLITEFFFGKLSRGF